MSVLCNSIIEDIEDLIPPKGIYKYKYDFEIKESIKETRKNNELLHPEIEIYSSIIPGTQTIYIKTWGCTHNNSDSEYMAGQLAEYGYNLTEDKYIADLWLLNSCTVKNPAEDHFKNEIIAGKKFGKHIVVAGCVSQGAPNSKFIHGLSVIGVQQIDKVIEVVEETLKGNSIRYLSQKKEAGKKIGGALLSLPKVRKNPLIEIIAINTGCLNQCTYCKTKHARGELGSYKPKDIIDRAKQAFEEGVIEIWLTSEDTGAYGRDIGTNLPELLWKIVEIIPDGCKMRIGMTNPPYIFDHLEEICKILKHPKVYSFLHIPVQSGSDKVLSSMKREYTRDDFEYIIDFLKLEIPRITIATDIICGFPSETEEDFRDTMTLCKKYKFPTLFINQFFPRPGTPAATMAQIPKHEIKKRTKLLSQFFQSYQPYNYEIGEIQEVLVTEVAYDKKHYVAHNKYYEQVLVPMKQEYMGKTIKVIIVSASKHSLNGKPLNTDFTLSLNYAFNRGLISNLIHDLDPYQKHILTILVIFFVLLVRLFWKLIML